MNKIEEKKEGFHSSIIKSTGLFGMVQIVKLFVRLIVNKFTAVFLGAEGVGLIGLLQNTLDLVGSFTGLGFNITGSRAIALAETESDDKKVSETMLVLKKWAYLIGGSSAALSMIFSKGLSQLTFGTPDYYYWFIFLGFYFVFSSLTSSYAAILQGKRQLKFIAKIAVYSTVIIGVLTYFIYDCFRKEGILLLTIVTALVNLLLHIIYIRKIEVKTVLLSNKQIWKKGIPIIRTGFLLSINVIFGRICFYIIRLVLSQKGASMEILGYYEVATVIMVTYLGIVFTAMSTDYFPRLTGLIHHPKKFETLVNHQIQVAVLLISPCLCFIYAFGPYLLKILYTEQFVIVYEILKLGLLAIFFKAIIWPLGYIILAQGDNRQYFKQEIISDFMNVSFVVFFYHFYGIFGIGIGMLLNYFLYGIYIYFVIKNKYNISFSKSTIRLIIQTFFGVFLISILVLMFEYTEVFVYLIFLAIVIGVFSLVLIAKKTEWKKIWFKIKTKIKS